MQSNTRKQRDTRKFILEKAIPLFSDRGYSGVSMRNIATLIGISTAALYHHFPDKQALYLEALEHAFADKTDALKEVVEVSGRPSERLEYFIQQFAQMVSSDMVFLKLMHREKLDGDEARLKLLTEKVFLNAYMTISGLIDDLKIDWDPHMLMSSINGLVVHHYESSAVRKYLPGAKPEHDDPVVVAKHVSRLLLEGLSIPDE